MLFVVCLLLMCFVLWLLFVGFEMFCGDGFCCGICLLFKLWVVGCWLNSWLGGWAYLLVDVYGALLRCGVFWCVLCNFVLLFITLFCLGWLFVCDLQCCCLVVALRRPLVGMGFIVEWCLGLFGFDCGFNGVMCWWGRVWYLVVTLVGLLCLVGCCWICFCDGGC